MTSKSGLDYIGNNKTREIANGYGDHISINAFFTIHCVPKKVTPKYKSQQLRQILSELTILLATLIITFLAQTLQISTKSTAQFLSNSCLKNGTQNRSFQSGKYQLAYLLHEVLRVMT